MNFIWRVTPMKRLVFTILVVAAICSIAQAKYSGGSGEPNNPYLISTAEDMNQIGRNYTDWEKHFKLTADINLSAYTGTQFSRIGPDDKHAFSGVFDGNGHTISGFTYTAENSDYIGVFGNISDAGRVENVSLVDVNVTGYQYVGGLVGYNKGTISNCSSTGNVTGTYDVGGLVGYSNGGSISNCYSTGAVTGSSNSYYVGGLVGFNDGSISNCYSTGAVTGTSYLGGLTGGNYGNVNNCYSTGAVSGTCCYVGGLVGISYDGSISNCNSTGTVTGGDNSQYLGGLVGYSGSSISNCNSTGAVTGGDYSNYLGGLVGCSYGNISNCYSTGVVTGGYNSDYLGGLVGDIYNYSVVTDCYATGEVAGDYDVGGLVGMNEHGTITRCYSSGSVSGYMYVGGLLGWNYEGTTTDSFWDTDTSGQSWSDGGTGKTTVEMKIKSTFTDAGWNFTTIWAICEGTNYPRLLWSIPAADLVCPDGVNFVDYSFFAERWLNTNCASKDNCDGTDFDFSGTVDIADLEIFCNYWLEGI